MPVKLMSMSEVRDDVMTSEFKSICLLNKNAGVLIPFNSKTVTVEQRMNEIERRLGSKALVPGVYQIHAKHWNTDVVPSVYYVSAGNLDDAMLDVELEQPENTPVKRRVSMSEGSAYIVQDNSVTWSKYQELLEENLELQAVVNRLNMEIDHLNQELDEMENEEPKEGVLGLGQGTQDWLKNMMETVAPIVQKVLDQKDVQQEIQKTSLYWEQVKAGYLPAPGRQPERSPGQQQMNDPEEEEEEDLSEEEELFLDKFEYLKQIDPDLYNKTISAMRNYNQE